MRERVRRDPVGVAGRDASADNATLWTTLQGRVCFGAHDCFIRTRHVPDPHIELFALGVLRGLRVVLGARQLARPLVLEVRVILLLAAQCGVASGAVHVQERTVDRVQSQRLLLRVCREATILWMRLVIRTADEIVDCTATDHGRERLLLLARLLLQLLGHLVNIPVPRYLEFLLWRHSGLRSHDLYVVKVHVSIWQAESLRYLLLGYVEYLGVLCEGQAAIGAVKVLDESVTSILYGLSGWLPPSLTLLLSYIVLAVTHSATLFALKICVA